MGRIAQAVRDAVAIDGTSNEWTLYLPREIADLFYAHTRRQHNLDALRMVMCSSRKNSAFRNHDGNTETCGN